MNFLAHFHLAWPDPGLVAGALEGDYLKGPLCGQCSRDIEAGVKLHRAVDAYTDSHPVLAALRQQFPPHLRRYAGIVTDISFDHYLSLNWRQYHPHPLPDFSRAVYRVLQARQPELGPGAQRMAQRLTDYDILNAYHRWDAVTGTAERIGQRLRRGNALAGLAPHLQPLRPAMEAAFVDFYPQLQDFAADFRRRLNQSGAGDSY
ncbi:ACP phosphodiesterase [Parahaliea mediterranea]|uniref:acyl carrier protein phosphodiesterase n=1 Tax=Parahaliea mediterranea TaxID=651086 RepID=UPI001300AA9A|nr:ACP phosphodiesterase [Parahaliea mediterranea]